MRGCRLPADDVHVRIPNRRRMYELLDLGHGDDWASRILDWSLISLIVLNVVANVLESVPELRHAHALAFTNFELFSVAAFSLEYVLRLVCVVESDDPRFQDPVRGRLRYAASPLAVTDLLAILPFYLSAVLPLDLRMLRVLRLLRIFKLAHYFSALSILLDVIRLERHAFGAAYFVVVLGLVLAASGVYVFEHEAQPEAFGSIPAALWWSVATLTTVGYGDVTPVTLGGKIFGTAVMMLGVGTVAVPTGILATGFALELRKRRSEYSEQVTAALLDGHIEPREREQLERTRLALALGTEETVELEVAAEARLRREQASSAAPLLHCPHCGELFTAPPKDPAPRATGREGTP